MSSIVPAGERRQGAADRRDPSYVLDFRIVLDSFSDAVVAADPTQAVVYLNGAAERLLGWTHDDLVGRPLWTIVPERLRPVHEAAFDRYVTSGESRLMGVPLVLPARRRDGTETEIELTVSTIDRPDDEPLIIGVLRDVTERIELELHNALSRHLIQVMAESDHLGEATPRILEGICDTFGWDIGALWTLDRTGTALRCERMWHAGGNPRPEFTAITLATRLSKGVGLPGTAWAQESPVWVPDVLESDNFPRAPQAAADGLHAAFAFPVLGDHGLLGVLEFLSEEVREPESEMIEAIETIGPELGAFIERRHREDVLQLERALLESQSENTLDGILVVDAHGTMISFNKRFIEMWGIPDEVVAARSDDAAIQFVLGTLKDPERFQERIRYLYDHPYEHSREEVELLDGRIFDRYSAPLKGVDGSYLGRAWYTRDVTQERLAEQRLAESTMRYRHLAKTLQESLLPPVAIDIPGAEMATLYQPVGEANVVGGDFYDFFRPREDEWVIVVGDVCGKGVEAAAVTSLVRYTMRAVSMRGARPEDVLNDTNAAMLMHGMEERFCTVAYVHMRPTDGGFLLSAASAGNPPPLILRRGGEVDVVGEPGVPLGVFSDPGIRTVDGRLMSGETLVVYTDGVTDSGGDVKALGAQGLRSLLAHSDAPSAMELVEDIRTVITRATITERRDDCALVALRVKGQ